jgi:hypothetical protein
MSDTLDRLEILIGKSLDGELSPKERCLLENELQQDRHAKELFEQMRVLHECSCGVVTHEILGRGADPAAVFERAWQQDKRSFWRRVAQRVPHREGARVGARADGHLRFVAGVAAGLLLGLIMNFVSVVQTKTTGDVPPWRQQVVRNVPPGGNEQIGMVPASLPQDPGQTNREVDWYVYTDQAGNRWLVEGTCEGMVKPVAQRGDL